MDPIKTYMVKAKFVGWKDGRLIKGAPGGIPPGTIWTMQYQAAVSFPWWEPLEKPPQLEVPTDEEDSVFEDVLLPDEETEEQLSPQVAKIIAEDPSMRGLADHVIDVTPPYIPVSLDSMSKEDLVKRIKEKGGQANMSMRKDALKERLAELNSSPQ